MTICRTGFLSLVSAAILAASVPGAQAQDGQDERPMPATQFVIDLGAGVAVQPEYPGSEDYLAYPVPIVAFGRFYVPGLGQVSDGEEVTRGFFFFPSFDVIGERKASDSASLTGTNTIDWAVELGAGAGYRYDWLRGFVVVRQGFNGHEGQVAEFGLDVVTNPLERVTFSFGPRATWGSGDYMDTYFGVTPAEAAAGPLTAYNPDSGFKTVGVAARASYAWTDNVALHLQGGWDRFVGDAADSPIVMAGDENQFSVGAGVSYRFGFNLFD